MGEKRSGGEGGAGRGGSGDLGGWQVGVKHGLKQGRDSHEHAVPILVVLIKRLRKYFDSTGCHGTVWRNIFAATHLSTVRPVQRAQLSNLIRL